MEPDDFKKAVAETIKAQLHNLHISRSQFANMMQTQPSVVTKWLSGKHNFTLETLCDIESKLKERRDFVNKLNRPVNQVEITSVLPVAYNPSKQ